MVISFCVGSELTDVVVTPLPATVTSLPFRANWKWLSSVSAPGVVWSENHSHEWRGLTGRCTRCWAFLSEALALLPEKMGIRCVRAESGFSKRRCGRFSTSGSCLIWWWRAWRLFGASPLSAYFNHPNFDRFSFLSVKEFLRNDYFTCRLKRFLSRMVPSAKASCAKALL
jgi:hypothetical protein